MAEATRAYVPRIIVLAFAALAATSALLILGLFFSSSEAHASDDSDGLIEEIVPSAAAIVDETVGSLLEKTPTVPAEPVTPPSPPTPPPTHTTTHTEPAQKTVTTASAVVKKATAELPKTKQIVASAIGSQLEHISSAVPLVTPVTDELSATAHSTLSTAQSSLDQITEVLIPTEPCSPAPVGDEAPPFLSAESLTETPALTKIPAMKTTWRAPAPSSHLLLADTPVEVSNGSPVLAVSEGSPLVKVLAPPGASSSGGGAHAASAVSPTVTQLIPHDLVGSAARDADSPPSSPTFKTDVSPD